MLFAVLRLDSSERRFCTELICRTHAPGERPGVDAALLRVNVALPLIAVRIEKSAGIRLIGATRELSAFKYEVTWHARLTANPAHEWFRNEVRAAAKKLRSENRV